MNTYKEYEEKLVKTAWSRKSRELIVFSLKWFVSGYSDPDSTNLHGIIVIIDSSIMILLWLELFLCISDYKWIQINIFH